MSFFIYSNRTDSRARQIYHFWHIGFICLKITLSSLFYLFVCLKWDLCCDSHSRSDCRSGKDTPVAIPHLLVEVKFKDWISYNHWWAKAFLSFPIMVNSPTYWCGLSATLYCCLSDTCCSAWMPLGAAVVHCVVFYFFPKVTLNLNYKEIQITG